MSEGMIGTLVGLAIGLVLWFLFPRTEVDTRTVHDTTVVHDTVQVVTTDTVERVPQEALDNLKAVLPAKHHPAYDRAVQRLEVPNE